MSIAEILAHPLLLLLVGAAITNYLLPRLTRRWQDRQKEIELKTAFVGEIADAVLKMITAVQYAELGAASQSQPDYDAAHRSWEMERARVDARLRGYFPDTDLPDEWRRLADVVSGLYALSGTHNSATREARIDELKAGLAEASLDWETLGSLEMKTGAHSTSLKERAEKCQAYFRAWFGVREAVLADLGTFVESVLDARSAWLSPRRRRSQHCTARRPPTVTVPIASETQVQYDIFGALAPPDLDAVDEANAESLARYARGWFNYGKPERAIEAMDRAVELDPDNVRILGQRALILRELNRLPDAIRDGERTTDLDPENARVWMFLGDTYHAAGLPEDALRALDRALELDAADAACWGAKARVLDTLHRTAEADVAYRNAGLARDEEAGLA